MARFANGGQLQVPRTPPSKLLIPAIEDYLNAGEVRLAMQARAGSDSSRLRHLEMLAWGRWRDARRRWLVSKGLTLRDAERLGLWHLGQRIRWREAES